jgi:tetratricopeptide (TPR) repeat protein
VAVSPRTRVIAFVTGAAVLGAAAALAVAVLAGADDERGGPRTGVPPLALDLGVRADREAVALRQAERLYADERRGDAARIFARYDSPEARIGAAFADWPADGLDRLERLAAEHPRSSLVRLHLGFARFWMGRDDRAIEAWRAAARLQPDSPSAGRAEDLLHPDFPRGRPIFVPSFASPPELAKLSPPRQFTVLERRARGRDPSAKLLYGVALQRLGRRLSAQRQFDAAVALDPDRAESHVAAAVARFDKARPSAAFARLGPLSRRFPRAQTVRFHLGLLLLWLARVQDGAADAGKSQLERARALAPRSRLGREANALLDSLENVKPR